MKEKFDQYDWPKWERALSGGEVLKQRANNAGRGRVAVVRVVEDGGRSYIVKCWSRMGLRALAAKVMRNSTGRNEFRTSVRMSELSHHYPSVMYYGEKYTKFPAYEEILVVEDLGKCKTSMQVLDGLFKSDIHSARAVEEGIIRQTRLMLDNGMVDIDHRLNNFLVTAQGFPVRIDFEHCKKYLNPYRHRQAVGRMLGVLVGSHIFASQPNTRLTEDFCIRLFAELRVGQETARISMGVVDEMIRQQQEKKGISVEFDFQYQ